MPFRLRSGLTYAACQDDIILLDLTRDRFFALPRTLHPDFLNLIEGGAVDPVDQAPLMKLFDPKDFIEIDSKEYSQTPIQAAPKGRLPLSSAAPDLAFSAIAFVLRALASLWLQITSLERVTRRLGMRKSLLGTDVMEMQQAKRVAAAFERITPFFPIKDRCLSVSVGLMWMMLLFRVPANMIIGVRTAPFSAHCWVTVDDLLVNDDLETARSFTPILTI